MTPEHIIEYWRQGANEDLAAAESLLGDGHCSHSYVLANFALEKALKAYLAKVTGEHPPRIQSLAGLAEKAGIPPSSSDERKKRCKSPTQRESHRNRRVVLRVTVNRGTHL